MASRTIILPLLRTPNKSKGNIDPLEYENWPHDRRRLVDDLWGLALHKLPHLPKLDKWVGENAKLVGRNLQPWRAVLAIAIWLQHCGVEGLYERMENLSLDYQKERPELEIADTTRIVIQALCSCASSAIRANSANSANKYVRQVNVTVADVTAAAKKIIVDEDIDLNTSYVTNKKIGRILSKLRFPEIPRQGGKGSRLREVNLNDLADLAESYKVDFQYQDILPEIGSSLAPPLPNNGTNGTNGSNGIQEDFQMDSKVD
jgi:hypothetical protein